MNGLNRIRAVAALLALLTLAGAAGAQTYTPEQATANHLSNFTYEVLPTAGIYQDFGQRGSGRGWAVDSVRAGANVIFFGAFYHYAPDGKATWNTHQGNITQATVANYIADGVPAIVRGPMYVGQNGPCIDCPMVTSSLITAYPERVMKVTSTARLQFEQQNGEAPLNLALARSYSATSRWQALLDSGAVFAVKQRNALTGTMTVRNRGWVRFGKRKATVTNDIGQVIDANWNFIGVTPSRISDGQGGFLPSTMPAWLDIPAKNDITTQWELVCVYQVDTLTGPISQCDTNLLGVERTRNDRDGTTWLLDPVTDRLYGYQHQTQGSSFQRDNALIRNAWVLIDAGPDSQGLARFVVRQWSNVVNGIWMESEFTQLPLSTVQLAVPGYVPTNN